MNVRYRNQFKRDYRLMMKRRKNIDVLDKIILELAAPRALPESMRDHELTGNLRGYRECHIEPDWLLVYSYETVDGDEQLLLVRTGSHADILE
jgi:mRNA interferase YafQ